MKTNMHFGASPGLFRQAQILRNNPTPAEAKLWKYLRKNQTKFRIRRQHPIYKFIADFYCHRLRLIIEVDGGIHEDIETKIADDERSEILYGFGLHIIRFSNEQVLYDIDFVLSEIAFTIDKLKYLPLKV